MQDKEKKHKKQTEYYFKCYSNTQKQIEQESHNGIKYNWPQLRHAPIKFGRFIKLYNINDKVLYKQTDMGFAAETGFLGGGKGAVLPQKKV